MQNNESLLIEIALTPRFQRDLRELAKRYRSIRSDIQPLIDQLQAGEIPGDRIAGIKYQVFTVRVKIRDKISFFLTAFG